MLRNKTISSDDFNYMKVSLALGSYIWDVAGNRFLDFTSGWNTANLGWNNPEIADAVRLQNEKLPYAHFWNSTDIQDHYAEQLLDALPDGFLYVARATGGTEANEMAIKTARIFTRRKKILGFNGSYHGQTFGLLKFGSLTDVTLPLAGADDFIGMDFPEKTAGKSDAEILNDFKDDLVRHLAADDVAAILCEPGIISGGGGTETAPIGFMKILRKVTAAHGTLIILDEVGTGFSRLGALFGMDIEGMRPDIATFAKAIANGQGALGALVTTAEIAAATHMDSVLISTFGWLPPAVAAASKTLEIHIRDKIFDSARKNGGYIMGVLADELDGCPYFDAINGIGMEIGVSFNRPGIVDKIVAIARQNGLYIVPGTETNIQLMPQLNIDRAELDVGLDIFIKSVKKAVG